MSKRLLCFGDSNTFGYDPRDPLNARYPEAIRWTGQLGPQWEVENCGFNGLKIPIPDFWPDYDALFTSLTPADGMTVMLGTNDLLQHSDWTAGHVTERMEQLLGHLQTLPALQDIPLILIAPPRMKRGLWVDSDDLVARSGQLPEHYAALAKKLGLLFADANDWGVALTYDGVHFSPEGHRAFAQGLSAFLLSLQSR